MSLTSILKTISNPVASKLIFDSENNAIKGIDNNNGMVNKANVIDKASVISKANTKTFQLKTT